MRQLFFAQGKPTILEVPIPLMDDHSVMVEVAYSFISIGTEFHTLKQAGKGLIGKILSQPEKIEKAVNIAKSEGLFKAVKKSTLKVRDLKDAKLSLQPIGYSCSGIVVDVGRMVKDIKIGDEVACGGANLANHAEVVCVPRNLLVKVPQGCSLKDASSVTLGAIALQGVRRADNRLGETVAIIGLGLIGQLTVQLLINAGCRVIGIDIDKTRVDIASEPRKVWGLNPAVDDPVSSVLNLTGGKGVDSTIVTAASENKDLCQQAMEITRKKGRVVVVGFVGMNLKREPFYSKEIDFVISCSYGPGRYDPNYEEKSQDYPYAYVRWTENRNMEEFLRQVAEGKIDVSRLIEKECSFEQALDAYKEMENARPLGQVLKYNISEEERESKFKRTLAISPKPLSIEGRIQVAVIGAGNFARAVHLPNLLKLKGIYELKAVMSRSGSNAKEIAQRYGASWATTSYDDVLSNREINMVMICTRHNLHADMAVKALKSGKAVFVEKPMALNEEDLDILTETIGETSLPFMVGFNRRFSPYAVEVKKVLEKRVNPIMIYYRMNAGRLPPDHWVYTEEGGGRCIGEACHIFDLFSYWIGSPVKDIKVSSLNPPGGDFHVSDNFVVSITYYDGSVATLNYTSLGNKLFPKEYAEIFFDGQTVIIDDYRSLESFDLKHQYRQKKSAKGHFEELKNFGNRIINKDDVSILLGQLVETTRISFKVDRLLTGDE